MAIRDWGELENGRCYEVRVTRPRSLSAEPTDHILTVRIVGRKPAGVLARDQVTMATFTLDSRNFREASEVACK